MKPFAVFALFFLSLNAQASVRPYVTDGCTDFPDGTRDDPMKWHQCCVLHDLAYWGGGTPEAFKKADLALRACVAATGETKVAELMYIGVRLGHLSSRGIPGKQWGNAWSETERRTTALTRGEISELQSEILQSQYSQILPLTTRLFYIQYLKQTN